MGKTFLRVALSAMIAGFAAVSCISAVNAAGFGPSPRPYINGQLPGTATNDNASVGSVGEFISASLAGGSAVSMAIAGTDTNITSISLTAGDWDVNGAVVFGGTSVNATLMVAGVSSTSNTQPSQPTTGRGSMSQAAAAPANAVVTGRERFSLSATTTVYLVASCVAGAGTCTGFGKIEARRVR